ncbi:hypothetical protein GGI42DRAFT_240519 [Trichoderma sp. SZMC 28013]
MAASTKTSSDIIPISSSIVFAFAFAFAAVTMDGAPKAAQADCGTTSGRSYSEQSSLSAARGKHRQVALRTGRDQQLGSKHSRRRWTEHLMLPSNALINVSLDHRLTACVNQCTPKTAPDTKKKGSFQVVAPRTTPKHATQFPISTPPTNYVWRPQAAQTPESACASDLQHQPRAALPSGSVIFLSLPYLLVLVLVLTVSPKYPPRHSRLLVHGGRQLATLLSLNLLLYPPLVRGARDST